MDSILTSVKEMLGIAEEYTHFDNVLIMHINSVFMALTQMGIGPSEGFSIQDADQVWTDFVSEEDDMEGVKTYVGLRVKLIFDNASCSGTVIEVMNRTISELEYRLFVKAESKSS
jgi:uncharacterized ion transporter superfamily protein YfcC